MKCATDSVKCWIDSVVGNWRDGRGRASTREQMRPLVCMSLEDREWSFQQLEKNICALNQPTEYMKVQYSQTVDIYVSSYRDDCIRKEPLVIVHV